MSAAEQLTAAASALVERAQQDPEAVEQLIGELSATCPEDASAVIALRTATARFFQAIRASLTERIP